MQILGWECSFRRWGPPKGWVSPKLHQLQSIASAENLRKLQLNFKVQILPNLTTYNIVFVFSNPYISFSKVPSLPNFQGIVYTMD